MEKEQLSDSTIRLFKKVALGRVKHMHLNEPAFKICAIRYELMKLVEDEIYYRKHLRGQELFRGITYFYLNYNKC